MAPSVSDVAIIGYDASVDAAPDPVLIASSSATLTDLGISRDKSHRFQQAAAAPKKLEKNQNTRPPELSVTNPGTPAAATGIAPAILKASPRYQLSWLWTCSSSSTPTVSTKRPPNTQT
ncbi:MAG: hypothetical protein ABIX37_01830 [Gammaproteobacteria bacterium]